jgi:hypothetical protein
MIYNLYLNSTQYFSTNDASNSAHRVYGVDWSFLPEYKHYKVKFNFLSKSNSTTPYTYANIYMVGSNSIGPLSLVYAGGKTVSKQNSSILGLLRVQQGNVSATYANDSAIIALSTDNPQFCMLSRPSNNLLEINLWKNTPGTLATEITTDYILNLSFEEIK